MTPAQTPVSRRPRLFYGWWIVVATVLMIFYYTGTVFYSFTLLVTPITTDLGWSTTIISQGFLIAGVLGASLATVLGVIFDRYGPKLVVAGGLLVGGLGFLLISRMAAPWHFYIAMTLAGVGPVAIYSGAVPAVANWFVRGRGRALGLTIVGEGLGGLVAPVVLVLVSILGWRGAVTVVAIGIWAFLLPLVLVLRRRPEDYGQLPDGRLAESSLKEASALATATAQEEVEGLTISQAVRTPVFWVLALVFALAFLPMGGIQVHLAPYLEGVGVTRPLIAGMLTFVALAAITGQLVGGWLVDKIDARIVAALALGVQAVGMAALSRVTGNAAWLLAPFVVAFAPGFGGVTVLWPALLGLYFGRRSFGGIQGVLWTVTSLAFASAPLTLGWLSGALGGYRPGLLLFGALTGVGAAVCLRLPRPGLVAVGVPAPAQMGD